MRQTLVEQFAARAEAHPERVAVHHRGFDHTYGELAERARTFAGWLQSVGVAGGERVLLLLPNCWEYVVCYIGTQQAGGVVVGLNPQTTTAELNGLLRHAEPTVLVVHAKGGRLLDEIAALGLPGSVRAVVRLDDGIHPRPNGGFFEVAFDEAVGRFNDARREASGNGLAQIIYTSGTTGRPKGVMLSHRNIAANCGSIVEYLQLTPADSVLAVLPFFYSYGNSLLFTHLAVGGRLVLGSEFVFWNSVLDWMEQQEVTGFAGVPATYALLLHRSNLKRRTFPRLRYVTCAGGALPPAHTQALRATLPAAQLFLMYGQTEGTARLSTLLPEDLDRKGGSIGRGIAGVELRVLDDEGQPTVPGDVGEIVARGENVMEGYWRDPAATARVLKPEGLRTGDLARVDDEGFVYIVGRNNDMIKSGAYRINPQEIEDVIAAVSGVGECAVAGGTDEIWGERAVAFVVPAVDGDVDLDQRVWARCRDGLPRYKQPREVRIVDELPRTASGKVQRAKLRAELVAEASTV